MISPVGVAMDDTGNIFVSDCRGFIHKITPDGESLKFAEGDIFQCPNGLTIDDQNNLYPVNFRNGNVLKITPEGAVSVFATINGNSNAHITFANNRLYVLGRNANQIFEVTLEGKVTLIAGNGLAGNIDGHSSRASFFSLNGIDADKDGKKLYVTSALVGTGTQLNPVVVRVIELIE